MKKEQAGKVPKEKKGEKKKPEGTLEQSKQALQNKMRMYKKRGSPAPQRFLRIIVWVLLSYFLISFIYSDYQGKEEALEPTFSDVVTSIQENKVESITVRGRGVEVIYTDGAEGTLRKDAIASFDATLTNLGVTPEQFAGIAYSVEKETGAGFWFRSILPFIFPALLLLLFIWFFTQQRGGGMQIFQFGRARARFINPEDKENRVTFADVAGASEAKQELQEFVEFLKHPDRFLKIGAKVPKGVMLTGAPGTGKTLLARAVAGEAGVPFFSISGSEFVEMFVGVGAARVRDLFSNAKTAAPSIIFIDEIDAVGRARGSGLGGGNDEREQALNQILVEMDGFEQTDKVIVLASTNRPDILDNALLRPGRFDRKILVGLPDIKERESILQVHTKGKKLDDNVKLHVIARRTPGFSGADLASVVNEGAIFAVRASRAVIKQEDLLSAIEKVMLGPERKGRVITPREKEMIAYHEAGHALLASLLPYADPVQKITIVARGHAGGYVLSLPDEERQLKTRNEFIDNIAMILGGYTAEKLVFGDISTGPSSDLVEASRLATKMVTRFGMSDKLGPMVLRQRNAETMMGGREIHGPDTEKEIDSEVEKIIKDAHKKAQKILKDNKDSLDMIVKKLLEVETLERDEYEALLKEHGVKLQNAFEK